MAKWVDAIYETENGEPFEFTGEYKCSECDARAIYNDESDINYLTPYCPYCGAKMENPNGQE